MPTVAGLRRWELGRNGKSTGSMGAVYIINWNSSLTHEAVGWLVGLPA